MTMLKIFVIPFDKKHKIKTSIFCYKKVISPKNKCINIGKFILGTESETKAFMAVCIETAKRYNLDDYRTPVFIFERLCSIIYPVSDSAPDDLRTFFPILSLSSPNFPVFSRVRRRRMK